MQLRPRAENGLRRQLLRLRRHLLMEMKISTTMITKMDRTTLMGRAITVCHDTRMASGLATKEESRTEDSELDGCGGTEVSRVQYRPRKPFLRSFLGFSTFIRSLSRPPSLQPLVSIFSRLVPSSSPS